MTRRESGMRVLVLDDSTTSLCATQIILEDAGYQVVTTSNPLIVHYLIRDVEMVSVNGDTVVRILQRNATHPRSMRPVIVLHSSRPRHELEQLVGVCDADGFIEKASGAQHLVSEVARFLALKPARSRTLTDWRTQG
jgi:CheY-like chemotaxis protein